MENSDKPNVPVPVKRGRGRPTKEMAPIVRAEKLAAKRAKKKLQAGRPKELGTKVQELKVRLLTSEYSSKIVDRVIEKALNDEDKDQMVALKLCLDRILPVSLFEKAKNEGARIQVNISNYEPEATITIDAEDATVVEE